MNTKYIAISNDQTTAVYLYSEEELEQAIKNECTIYALKNYPDGEKEVIYTPERGWVIEECPSFELETQTLNLTSKLYADIQYLSMMTGIDLNPTTTESQRKVRFAQSRNYNLVKGFYEKELWSEARVLNAIGLWITRDEYFEIIGKDE